MTSVKDFQEKYFEIVDRHLSGPLKPLWETLSFEIRSPNRENLLRKTLDLLQPASGLLVPDPHLPGTWITSEASHIAAFADEIASFWSSSGRSQEALLRQNSKLSYYYPHPNFEAHIRSALAYFDFIAFPDPIERVMLLLRDREHEFQQAPMDGIYRRNFELGMNIKIVQHLEYLWWILRYRSLWSNVPDEMRFVVVGGAKTGFADFHARREAAYKIALQLLSELAGDQFSEPSDIMERFNNSSPTPWLNIAKTDEVIRSVLSTGEDNISDQMIVDTLTAFLAMQGFDYEGLRVDDSLTLQRNVGFGLFNYLGTVYQYLLDLAWQASMVDADAGVNSHYWLAHERMMILLGGGVLPERTVPPTQVAALTLQNSGLSFLGHLSDEDLATLRSNDRLTQMREAMSQHHADLRIRLAEAPIAAREYAERFTALIDEYEVNLQEAMRVRRSMWAETMSRAKHDVGELALTTAAGVFGLVVAPPWSFLVTALSALVGGQSIRGLILSARQDVKEKEATLVDLQQSPLGVCLTARRKAPQK